MINYKDYQKQVYDWLIDKNKQDPNFTFSLRENEEKGSELHYFMGGEKSRYFTFRLWSIPTFSNSSPGNCLGVVFKYSANHLKYDYDFKLTITNSPRDKQSASILNLIKSLIDPLDQSIGLANKGNTKINDLEIRAISQKRGYADFEDMLKDFDADLAKFIPLVNKYIEIEKNINPEFEAYRISQNEFESMQEELQIRFEKHRSLRNQIEKVMNLKEEFMIWLLNKPKSNYFNNDKEKLSKYLDTYNTYFVIDIFEVSISNYKKILEVIDAVAYQNEQSEFFKYSNKESTHRPRAILGKTNYYQFLKEKFDSKMLKSGNKQALLKINNLLEKYKSAILNDNWLYVELYKFEWANWLTERVNFDKQTNEEILELCLASQNENYTDAKGVQFIQQGAREKLSKYIGIEDVKIFREFYNGLELENIDYSNRNMSFPILSCWMSVFAPNFIFPASRTSFADIIRKVFVIKLRSSNIDFVINMQKPMQEICTVLLENDEIIDFVSQKLHKLELSQLDLNWLTQDFLLYVDRHPNLLNPIIETTEEDKEQNSMLNITPTNQILYGPPGTGKTYQSISKAVSIIDPKFYNKNKADRNEINDKFKELLISNWSESKGQIAFCTFHQSFTYEDFVEGIKPKVVDDSNVIYEIQKGVFKAICDRARTASVNSADFNEVINKFQNEILENGIVTLETDRGYKFDVNYTGLSTFRIRPHESNAENPQYPAAIENIRMLYEGTPLTELYNPSYVKGILLHLYKKYNLPEFKNVKDNNKPYVLIIDEINRGNVASIFGELITLIEENKRAGADEELSVTLPYSKKEFSVPKNVYIIGTMNTADRSIEALDSALRRRFSFTEVKPKPSVIDEVLKEKAVWSSISLSEILETINKRITVLIDRDHQIGHSYFLKLKKVDELDFSQALKAIFTENIIPLLQEYFFNDYVKIGMLLGSGFIKITDASENLFAEIEDSLEDDYSDAKEYEFIDLETVDDNQFESILKLLLNK